MNEIYMEFEKWLNKQTANSMPETTQAFCFNLYEESAEESEYSVQLVACDKFDKDDSDWACEEVWSSEEDIFCIGLSDEENKDRDAAQTLIKSWIEEYIKTRGVLKSNPVAVGFIDGELEIISG